MTEDIPHALIEAIGHAQMRHTGKTAYVWMDNHAFWHTDDDVPSWCERWWEVTPDGCVRECAVEYKQ